MSTISPSETKGLGTPLTPSSVDTIYLLPTQARGPVPDPSSWSSTAGTCGAAMRCTAPMKMVVEHHPPARSWSARWQRTTATSRTSAEVLDIRRRTIHLRTQAAALYEGST